MTCRKNYWGTCFQQLTTYMYKKKRKKCLRSSHVYGKHEIACFHVETATGNRIDRYNNKVCTNNRVKAGNDVINILTSYAIRVPVLVSYELRIFQLNNPIYRVNKQYSVFMRM